jgi:DNA-binding NtrC family response regulator
MKHSVLVVDDDSLVNELAYETLHRAGYDCRTAHSAEEALAELNDREADIVLSDLKMPGMDGIELLKQVKRTTPDTIVIMITAFGTIETAVRAIKLGADDFLIKPIVPETLEHITARASEILDLSKVMKEIFDLIESIADARSTVMLTGASGTGKELVARAIHYSSKRGEGPFIKLNCAALPENLVEAELFGYEKGAFTDAKKTNRGRFELADGGTLLLDEISEMPMNLQAKLLRVIQEREFERVGSSHTISVDVRIIATALP